MEERADRNSQVSSVDIFLHSSNASGGGHAHHLGAPTSRDRTKLDCFWARTADNELTARDPDANDDLFARRKRGRVENVCDHRVRHKARPRWNHVVAATAIEASTTRSVYAGSDRGTPTGSDCAVISNCADCAAKSYVCCQLGHPCDPTECVGHDRDFCCVLGRDRQMLPIAPAATGADSAARRFDACRPGREYFGHNAAGKIALGLDQFDPNMVTRHHARHKDHPSVRQSPEALPAGHQSIDADVLVCVALTVIHSAQRKAAPTNSTPEPRANEPGCCSSRRRAEETDQLERRRLLDWANNRLARGAGSDGLSTDWDCGTVSSSGWPARRRSQRVRSSAGMGLPIT